MLEDLVSFIAVEAVGSMVGERWRRGRSPSLVFSDATAPVPRNGLKLLLGSAVAVATLALSLSRLGEGSVLSAAYCSVAFCMSLFTAVQARRRVLRLNHSPTAAVLVLWFARVAVVLCVILGIAIVVNALVNPQVA